VGLKEGFPFASRIIIEELDLKKLNDSYKTQKETSGYFNAEANIGGNLKAITDVTGTGWMEITQGRLFELPLLKGLLGIIDTSGAEKNVFREAHCDFVVKDKAITTENLELVSQRLTINGKGSVYLDGKLDMRISYSLPEQKEETSGLDKLQDLLLKGTSSLVKEVTLGGTLKKPEYKIIPVSINNFLQNILK
ncbi:MAG: AsmA-like C-terminal domain-containing protein, partial [Candidatus Omnitrophica bacterium]|nr:AsmA-like C-terminal domain-containing protein [Candidatus Omnitrophota bacterium]